MPTPAPSAPAPDAVAPLTANPNVFPSTPAPATPPATPAPDQKQAGRGGRLFGLLAAEAEVPPGTKAPDKKPDPATPPAPDGKDPKAATPAATPASAADPDDKPIKAERKKAITKRPDLPTATPVATPAAPAPAPAAAAPESDADLVEEERALIDEAAEAEKHLPNRKGLAEQTRKFVRAHQKYLEAHPDIEDDPDEKAAYQKFLRANKPTLTAAERQAVSESRIVAKVSKPLEDKTAQLEHEIYVRDQEPVLREQRNRVASELNGAVIPSEILEFAQKYGVDTAKKEYADELGVVNNLVSTVASDYEELIRLETYHPKSGRAVSTPAENEKDPRFAQHQRLVNIVAKVDEEFKETAKQGELLRDGKWFVTREEWASLPPAARSQYWKFSNREVATRMLAWVKPAVEITIKNQREEMARRGYERRKFVPPAAPVTPAAPPTPVRSPGGAAPTPVPAPSGSPSPATPASRLASALAGD